MATLAVGAPLGAIADILDAAIVLGPTAWHGGASREISLAAQSQESLQRDLIDLFAILHDRKVRYLLVGGVAILTYIEGRNTKDVDLILSVDSLDLLPEIVISERNSDFAHGLFRTLRVDVLLTTNPLFKLVQERYSTKHRFLETDAQCATVEGLILLKLYALPSLYRQGDGQRIGLYENDIFMLIERHRPDLKPLFGLLSPYLDADQITELRNIVVDIHRRIERIERGRLKKRPPKSP